LFIQVYLGEARRSFMRTGNGKSSGQLACLEQAAVLATSLVWTAIVLLVITFAWTYQDVQARWESLKPQPTPVPVAMMSVAVPEPTPTSLPPTDTPSPPPSPTPSPTPAPTNSPTPTATYMVGPEGVPPQILPETPLEEATPLIIEKDPTPERSASPTPTPVPPTETPTPVPELMPTNTPAPPPAPPPPPAVTGPSRVVIRSVGIDTPVVPVGWSIVDQNGQEFSVWDVADYAAGWHQTSAAPGQPGNTVLSGHHNIKGEVFRYLVDVQQGDEIDLFVGETVYQYYVEQKLIVKEKGEPIDVRRQNAQWIASTGDIRATLVTCWPYTNNTHRVIVVAKPRS
jgi:sortase A